MWSPRWAEEALSKGLSNTGLPGLFPVAGSSAHCRDNKTVVGSTNPGTREPRSTSFPVWDVLVSGASVSPMKKGVCSVSADNWVIRKMKGFVKFCVLGEGPGMW